MTVLAGNLVDRVAQIIPRYSMLSLGHRAGVAVSGGADSVVLLHILHRLAAKLRNELTVLHVNHRLRAKESDDDESFVRALADSLGLPIAVVQAPISGGNIELAARNARRKFFFESIRQFGLQQVALGHTQSDQAETILYRLLKGAGTAGLAGMRPVTKDGLIRPLLTTTRAEIREWGRAEGISWREDSSNLDLSFARNQLRHRTLPALTGDFNPNLEAVLAATASVAQAEEEFWNLRIEPIYHDFAKQTHLGSIFQIDRFDALHPAERRRLVRRAVAGVRGDLRSISLQHVEAILKICESRQGHDRVLIPGVDALRSFDQLLLGRPGELGNRPRHYSLPLKMGEEHELPCQAGRLYVNWVKYNTEFCANFKKETDLGVEVWDLAGDALAQEQILDCWRVRNWEPGDTLQRVGHRTAEKIKSLFQESRVLLWERKHWPVVTAGKEIVWTRQFGCAARFRASNQSDRVVRFVYCKEP